MASPRFKVYGPLCGMLHKEYHGPIVPWLVTDPDANKNCFTCSRKNIDWIFPGYQYSNKFKTEEELSIMESSVHSNSRRK